MGAYTEHALGILKQRGYRLTQPRRLVLEVLEAHEESLSPYDIRDLLATRGEPVDTVSIYRILECLSENHLIHRLLLQNGKVRKCKLTDESHCELTQHDHCHHFLICRQCNAIQEVHCVGLEPMALEVQKNTGFQVEHHHLEFEGLCAPCQAVQA